MRRNWGPKCLCGELRILRESALTICDKCLFVYPRGLIDDYLIMNCWITLCEITLLKHFRHLVFTFSQSSFTP
jgi:hypothetical protein